MPHFPSHNADPDNIATWAKFSAKLCRSCAASCCRLPVEVKIPDLVRLGQLDEFCRHEEPRLLARQLAKRGIVEHFHARSATYTLSRRADGSCLFLDHTDQRCTVYTRRPDTCRNHPIIGPRPGYCPFQRKK
jgi:Fe-S-cluster containining protein